MPYLTQERRDALNSGAKPENGGELNYLVCSMIEEFVLRKGVNYAIMQEAIGGTLEATAEFRRRIVVPYEDLKRMENGEVFNELVPLLDCLKQTEGNYYEQKQSQSQ